MVCKLTQVGSNSALVVDEATMKLLNITADTPLNVSVDGRRLIVEPAAEDDEEARFQRIVESTGRKNAELFRRLAK